MNQWQKRFAQKVEAAKATSFKRFEVTLDDKVVQVFEEFQSFVAHHGLQASVPANKNGIRTFKFAVSENAYVLITFRLSGLDGCEVRCEPFIPSEQKPPIFELRSSLSDLDADWARGVFEKTLDAFMDAFLELHAQRNGVHAETVGA